MESACPPGMLRALSGGRGCDPLPDGGARGGRGEEKEEKEKKEEEEKEKEKEEEKEEEEEQRAQEKEAKKPLKVLQLPMPTKATGVRADALKAYKEGVTAAH
eukprot:2267813-Rhodomonas_salina.2